MLDTGFLIRCNVGPGHHSSQRRHPVYSVEGLPDHSTRFLTCEKHDGLFTALQEVVAKKSEADVNIISCPKPDKTAAHKDAQHPTHFRNDPLSAQVLLYAEECTFGGKERASVKRIL